jgi:hypothetical protein
MAPCKSAVFLLGNFGMACQVAQLIYNHLRHINIPNRTRKALIRRPRQNLPAIKIENSLRTTRFHSARKTGSGGPTSPWEIAHSEVLQIADER